MSYMIYIEESSFFIKEKDLLEITLLLDKNPNIVSLSYIKSELDDIQGIFNDLGFVIDFDDKGNINNISVDEDIRLSNQAEFFKLIAPIVKDGSFIQFIGEDGRRWRWIFKNSEFLTIYPKIVWDM